MAIQRLVSLFNWKMVDNSLEKFSVDHYNPNILLFSAIIPLETFRKRLPTKIFIFFLRLIQQFKNPFEIPRMLSSNNQIKKYSTYTREMRLKLIQMVDVQNFSTAQAARLLGIKQTSACRIMKSFHKHNRIFEKKIDQLRRQKKSIGSDSSIKEECPGVSEIQGLNSLKQGEFREEGINSFPVLGNVGGVMVNSADFNSREYNSLICNSLFGFTYGYYQMYIPNISFGYFGCSN